jgi:hypothetical protein
MHSPRRNQRKATSAAASSRDTVERINILLSTLGDVPYPDLIVTADDISFFEHEFGLNLPAEYKEFITQFGWVAYGSEFVGLASAYTELTSLRKSHPCFPHNLVPIHKDNQGCYYCPVTCGKYRGHIILREPDLPSGDSFPHVPRGKVPDHWVRGLDFWSWLTNQLEREAAFQTVLRWLSGNFILPSTAKTFAAGYFPRIGMERLLVSRAA